MVIVLGVTKGERPTGSTSDRLLTILGLFTLERPDWSVDEAATGLGAPTSTIYRYFKSLTRSGFLIGSNSGRYCLGPTIIRYDRQLRLTDPLVVAAAAGMDRVSRLVAGKGVVFLCRLFGDQVMCVAQTAIGDPPFATSYERGRTMPLFAGSASRVILANLPRRHVRSLYARQPENFLRAGLGRSWPEVRTALRAMRDAGSSVTSGEVDAGMRGFSVPVISLDGSIIGRVSVVGRRKNLRLEAAEELFQEPGVRRSRALPYELHVHAKERDKAGKLELSFANTAADVVSLQEHRVKLGVRRPAIVLKIETRRGFSLRHCIARYGKRRRRYRESRLDYHRTRG